MVAIETTRMNIIRAILNINDLEILQQLEQQAIAVQDIQKPIVFAGIEHREGVANGNACVIGTRIPVWLLVQARKSGSSDADILSAYPRLGAKDIANAWNYYQVHRQEIDAIILENEAV